MRNPLSLEAFADWCEKQPADKRYDFCQPSTCAAAQYLQSVGVIDYVLPTYDLPAGWQKALNPEDERLHTFGALSARLRAASTSGRT